MRVSKNDLRVLQMLSKRPKGLYGKKLAEKLDISIGSIYVVLMRLERKKCLRTKTLETPEGERGPTRVVYVITATGKKLLNTLKKIDRLLKD